MHPGKCAARRMAKQAVYAIAALFAASMIFPGRSAAEGLSGYLEFDYSRIDSNLKDATGQSVQTKSDTFIQLYSLTLEKQVYPNLNFLASGVFQQNASSFDIEGLKNDTTTTTLRPYIDLNLKTPLYYGDVSYSRNEEQIKTSGFSPPATIREAYLATLYWKPDRFPDLRLTYARENLYDKDKSNLDITTDLYVLTTRYQPVDPLVLYYRGALRDIEDRVNGTTANETFNNARVTYANQWWQQRVSLGVDYNYTRNDIDTSTSGKGEVNFPVFPFAGLSALSDTPEDVALAPNPALIDGIFAAGAGINLGLPPPGGDARLRNVGLDFATDKQVNTLFVWVDRDVSQVAGSFSWRIYTSADNLKWVLRQTVAPAIYSPTFNRFEIRFADVTARYVKVVTAPLSPAVPFASNYPIILVTELQAEIRRPASEVSGKFSTEQQIGNLDFRLVLLQVPTLTYELTYFGVKNDPGILTYTLSNGLSITHQFNQVFSGRARVSVETGEEKLGRREAILYTASVTAVPFPTFYNSLVFSGQDQKIAGAQTTQNGVFLYNITKLYDGIDMNLGGGISFQEDERGKKVESTQLNGGATFVPNQKVTLNLLYNGSTTTTSGGDLAEERKDHTRAGEANLSVYPLQTLYLFGSFRVEKTTTGPSRNILNFSGNWSPFPDGALHLNFFYNENVETNGVDSRTITPSLRWYFTQSKSSYLDLSYQNLKTESAALTTFSRIYSGTVRISF